MRKFLDFLKTNIAFFVIALISLALYLIAILGGDYQTTVFFGEVTHRTFLGGIQEGVVLAFLYVIIPAICFVAICVLYFLKPKKIDGSYIRRLTPKKPKKETFEAPKERTLDLSAFYITAFIVFATLAGAMFVLIPFALFKDASVVYTELVDWKATTPDVFYIKTFNFPLLAMALHLVMTTILGCYSSATMSE